MSPSHLDSKIEYLVSVWISSIRWHFAIPLISPARRTILIPAIVCVLLPLQWGGSKYSWICSCIIGLLVGAGCLIILFSCSQIRLGDKGTLPPYLFQDRNTLCTFAFSALFGVGFLSLVLYLAIYFQSVKGSTALHAGIQALL